MFKWGGGGGGRLRIFLFLESRKIKREGVGLGVMQEGTRVWVGCLEVCGDFVVRSCVSTRGEKSRMKWNYRAREKCRGEGGETACGATSLLVLGPWNEKRTGQRMCGK